VSENGLQTIFSFLKFKLMNFAIHFSSPSNSIIGHDIIDL